MKMLYEYMRIFSFELREDTTDFPREALFSMESVIQKKRRCKEFIQKV